MKKLIYFFIGAALLAGCANGDEPTLLSREEASSHVIRSKAEAMDIALTHMQDRAGSRAGYSIADVDIVYNSSSRSQVDTLMYAVNFADDKGYVLVSAALMGDDILAYGDNGSLDVNNINPNSGFSLFMDAATTYVLDRIPKDSLILNPGGGLTPNPSKPVTTYEKVAPRVTVEWGQHYPEGALYYNWICGCAQTAVMQILSYFKEPKSISLTYPGHEIDYITIDWDKILEHKKSDHPEYIFGNVVSCSATADAHVSISRICREIGYRNHADDYSSFENTSTNIDSARITTRELMPSTIKVSDFKVYNSSYATFFDFMQKYNAVTYFDGKDTTGSRHAWVCSGGERITTTEKGVLIDGKDKVTIKIYFYFNWGYAGTYDGYFNAGVFDPEKSVVPSRYSYSNDLRYFSVY